MKTFPTVALILSLTITFFSSMHANSPVLPGVGDAVNAMIENREIAGAVTLVTSADEILHLETSGWADLASETPMRADNIFWIASMTKPITGIAALMLQEEGLLDINDPVAKYIPEFAELKTPSGRPADLTIEQLLLHTSGLSEAPRNISAQARTLEDLIPAFLASPTLFEPGERWQYSQSSINTAARIVEIVSGQPYEVFLEERLFGPLGMKDTAFYLTGEQAARMASLYARNLETGDLEPATPWMNPATRDRPPLANGGLFSTAPDYALLCQMLLNEGTFDGRRYLTPESIEQLIRDRTGDLNAGFVPGSAWGLGTSLVREPQGITAMLSPGTYGHGGAHGTQAWIDPVKGVAYILMVQRANFPNSDGSTVREAFQKAAAAALAER